MTDRLLLLRDDVLVHQGPEGMYGAPTWMLQDPVRNLFFQIDYPTFEILSRWDFGSASLIVESVNENTPLTITINDIEAVNKFLDAQCLLVRNTPEAVTALIDRADAAKQAWWLKLMHRYLFFRVPLINPDRWLERWLPVAEVILSKQFFIITFAALAFGLFEVSRQWATFQSTLIDTFTFQGFLAYGFALIAVKLLHELGHGFTAKRYGCQVPTMGVAFLVLLPMAYTDTNSVWRLADRHKRLIVATAGIRVELLVAAWATLAWAILPDGALRSAAFFLATLSWVLTLLLNVSPFMRFDGYFVLMDWLGYPNLHARSFAFARWKIREFLFALGEPCPEKGSVNFGRFLFVFAVATWIYRFFLFLGIAILIYYAVTKVLGVLLAAVELYWFILSPIIKELRLWWERRKEIKQSRRAKKWGVAIAVLLLFFIVPLPLPVSVQAVVRPAQYTDIVLPSAAELTHLWVANGDSVQAGDQLVDFSDPNIRMRKSLAQRRSELADWDYRGMGVGAEPTTSLPLAYRERYLASVEQKSTSLSLAKLSFSAPHDGVFKISDPDLEPGQWLPKDTVVGTLVHANGDFEVTAWVEEADINRVSVGTSAHFFNQIGQRSLAGTVVSIESDAADVLPIPALAVPFGGSILVRQQEGQLIPERGIYQVTVRLEDQPITQQVQYGQLSLRARPRTLGGHYIRSALSVFIRELSP